MKMNTLINNLWAKKEVNKENYSLSKMKLKNIKIYRM